MRFGRRVKNRPKMKAVGTVPHPSRTVGAVASEERHALIGASDLPDDASSSEEDLVAEDPTQHLLTSLGRFQRELTRAQTGADQSLWSDECMNQLIIAVEVAISHGWSDVVEALTNTGRVLQTYESAGLAQDCVPFLNDAYDVLCLMVGDLIVDTVRDDVKHKWRLLYESAAQNIEAAGLVLEQDEEEVPEDPDAHAPSLSVEIEVDASEADVPFTMPVMGGNPSSSDVELPTLDELPPLEELLEMGIGTDGGKKDRLAEARDGTPPETDSPEMALDKGPVESEEGPAVTSPPQRIEELLDLLCGQLTVVERGKPEGRDLAFERLSGGLAALGKEASGKDNERAEELCEVMARMCEKASQTPSHPKDRFVELGYAFCGVFMESMCGEGAGTAQNWKAECSALIEQWDLTPSTAAGEAPAAIEEERAEPGAAALDKEAAEALKSEACSNTEAGRKETDDLLTLLDQAMENSTEPEALREEEIGELAPAETEGEAVAVGTVETTGDAAQEEPPVAGYGELLESAQEAIRRGDGSMAKVFALQAAARISEAEAAKAEEQLCDAEGRLSSNILATQDARATVKDAEASVTQAATRTAEDETQLGAAIEHAATLEQECTDLRERAGAIEAEIEKLQEQLAEQVKCVSGANERQAVAKEEAEQSQGQFERCREAEEEARRLLETFRQDVKDNLRVTSELEGEVAKFRRNLDVQRKSQSDIEHTIQQVTGGADPSADGDELLF